MLQNITNEYPGPHPNTISSEEPSQWSFLSICIHTFLSVAGLSLLLLHKDFLLKLWIYLDCTFLSVMFPSFISKDKLLAWAQSRLPSNWSSQSKTLSSGLPELWQDGSLLCTLINTAVPGACANPHRHWNKPPIHAQDLAFKYLGVIPVFTEFEYQYPLSLKTERKFFHYLNLLRNRINNVSKTQPISQEISKWYVARGMGLYAGEQCKNAIFYIYPQITVSYYYNILIYIRGPYGTNGQIEFSHVASDKTFDFAQSKELLSIIATTENCIDMTKGFQNKITSQDKIKMTVKIEDDRAKITYLPAKSGIYEIFITCNGEPIVGSPFYANIFGTVSTKSFSNGTYIKTSDRKFSAEYYIRQTKMISVQNNSNKTDDQKRRRYKNEENLEITGKTSKTVNDEEATIGTNTEITKTSENASSTHSPIKTTEKRNILMELNNFNKTDKNKSDLKKLCHITMRSLSNDLVKNIPDNKTDIPNEDILPKTNMTKLGTFNKDAPVVLLAPLHPKTLQKIVQNHRCASPICLDHIVSEDGRCKEVTSNFANKQIEFKDESPIVMTTKSQETLKSINPASPICNNHIAFQRGLSKSVSDVRQLSLKRRDSLSSLRSFATDTQSFTCSESDFDTLESLPELNYFSPRSFNKRNSNINSIVLEKKLFWENLANDSDTIKTSNSENLLTSRVLSKSMTRLEEFKNYIKRNRNPSWLRSSKNRFKLSKSVDDVRCSGSAKNMSKFKTVDRSLEDCSKLRVDERKQIYLKQLENLAKKKNEFGSNIFSESLFKNNNHNELNIKAPQHVSCFSKCSKRSVHFQQSDGPSQNDSSLQEDPRLNDNINTFLKINSTKASSRDRLKSLFNYAIATLSRNKIWDGDNVKSRIKKRTTLSAIFDVIR